MLIANTLPKIFFVKLTNLHPCHLLIVHNILCRLTVHDGCVGFVYFCNEVHMSIELIM